MNSIDTLKPILHNQIPVITTELLAQLYGTEVINIQVNHTRNKGRFVEGKHYFKLEGAELKDFKNRLTESKSVAKRARALILWTERGAARHAKMLETDQAWEVFEQLEDCYFNQNKTTTPATHPVSQSEIDAYNINALAQHYQVMVDAWRYQIEPALRKIESPLAGRLRDRFIDGAIFLSYVKKSLNEKLGEGQRPRLSNHL
ncbi:ORF6N domain-containing protein [Yersinia enterocolitica]|uniref:ORF6N domain-containing protein n=1 Tax=Yersinia enterocolitica TaxID=630 RepID=UPI001C60E673|nr:ORF6N domain-containing protein [Yersinia enterocolitica]MBW5870527.1 ORF6N domain-containing protein [Yersinia enterocolitica]MBW5879357.1 ORF6N domain-containing protein [Yersinia enterocolitica]